ncbi:type II/IV secretion system protein [Candidatus Peregrinibacteria bacterium]|nr:type II/IV secretion system protein [Candidatus Peregrinibacteria bacterium]MBI3816759.1 type II/IV secretion system protein [Candidatus Peregrinibacteria bacterium]
MPIDFAALDGETLLKELQEDCTREGASDIHLSPQKKDVRLEVRLHGVLQRIASVAPKTYAELLRRVKFESKLKLNVTNIPQDGQYTFQVSQKTPHGERLRTVNVRVATLPSRFGEALTLRLLDPDRGILPLEKLGFPAEIRKTLEELVDLPHGLILVTGPTGSGKTTTLYALLSTIVGKARNIITLEDPVEYELAGIIQSEIDPAHDYTFASGLRSILRHDPDVILVGEIRDLETAQTAVNASLTGHLVFSTLHTNSAIEAVPRLLSMGVSPYTLAPALRAVLAQRLVRTLSDACRNKGAACDPAANSSYGGQISIPELFLMSPAIEQLILSLEQTAALEKQARAEGFASMQDWAAKIVAQGISTPFEVARAIG